MLVMVVGLKIPVRAALKTEEHALVIRASPWNSERHKAALLAIRARDKTSEYGREQIYAIQVRLELDKSQEDFPQRILSLELTDDSSFFLAAQRRNTLRGKTCTQSKSNETTS